MQCAGVLFVSVAFTVSAYTRVGVSIAHAYV
jgi:hypothetical protein